MVFLPLPVQPSQPSPHNSGNTTGSENAITGTSSGVLRKDSTEFHEWPREQLQKLRLGLPEEESLEQGPLLGRGGFGKVYKGGSPFTLALHGAVNESFAKTLGGWTAMVEHADWNAGRYRLGLGSAFCEGPLKGGMARGMRRMQDVCVRHDVAGYPDVNLPTLLWSHPDTAHSCWGRSRPLLCRKRKRVVWKSQTLIISIALAALRELFLS